ncbi:20S proteasome subunit A/B [Xanthomonas theicola]|uniref:20S proteasome subunit A/B n=1 Tax=Xanthomonas theicola TaxID=56464 RepID=A0A2S6ZJX2_9XANT|nr:20S proteasome subunit A/B [Xanthomonas theicola]PPT92479.1 20S proteasome subunit A/B [Xanthomonas theicola]QNH26442.1 20S proteasome subunit A/B [Xanthomonas theicola]
MTYCVGIEVDEGLVFAADTRTNASLDDVRVHRKLQVFEYSGQAVFVLMSAGNLATTQLAIARLQRDADDPDAPRSLRSFRHLFEVAEYVGEVLVSSQVKLSAQSQHSGVSVQSTLILGGQIAGERPGLYMIYPLGNAIATSPETPYLQIGESKYGKPILDRIIRPEMQLEDAARTALVSLDSTIRSNLSVGMPIDLALIRRNDLRATERLRLEADTPLYSEIHDTWSRKLENAVRTLPRFSWEPALTGESETDNRGALPPLPPRRVPARRDPEDQSSQQ